MAVKTRWDSIKIALVEALGFVILPWFCMAHSWTIGLSSIKPWPSGSEGVGPHRTEIDLWKWPKLNTWYMNVEDGVSGQQAWVWVTPKMPGPDSLVRYPDLFPKWMPAWCIAFAWSVWRNGANNVKRRFR